MTREDLLRSSLDMNGVCIMVSSESSVSPAAPHVCGGNLRPALGLGPGCDDATILIRANMPHSGPFASRVCP